MAKKFQAIRGMNDILPNETPYWQHIENTLRQIVASYGYQEIRFPLLEITELFIRTIGEVTDIVEKEMYTFNDRDNVSLSLRPEGTAGCVRAGIEQNLLYNQIQRLWYVGPMFRYEKPQRGRFRQFHQFGVEAFGLTGPDIDAEILLMSARFWEKLGIRNKVTLQLNTIGTKETRINYRQKLVDYFTANLDKLDEDSKKRLTRNPLRILDSKNPALQDLIQNAPKLLDNLDADSQKHFDDLRKFLDTAKLEYTINPCLVRGLDYYCHTVFEWVTDELGSQGAICAGGHYDGLVDELGGKATPAIGFAIGLERLVDLFRQTQNITTLPHAYIVALGEEAQIKGLLISEELRNTIPSIRLAMNCGNGNLTTQLKRADKSGALYALIIGEEELKSNQVTIKYLRTEMPKQEFIALDKLSTFFAM